MLSVRIEKANSEIAISSESGIVFSHSIPVGTDEFDQTILAYMKRAHDLMIGESTVEEIRTGIGSAFPLNPELTMKVKGRELRAGLRHDLSISSEEIREALREPLSTILNFIRNTLERCPPELSAEMVARGIIMTGSGTVLRGIEFLVAKETGLPVRVIRIASNT